MPKFPYKFDDDKTAKFPYLVLAVSLFITIGVTYNFYQSANTKDSGRFTNEVNRIQSVIDNKVNLYIAMLKGGRGFIESSGELNRAKFASYVKSLELGKNYAGVLGIGYSKVLMPDERAALVKRMQAEGYHDFRLFPETDKGQYQAILYLEPYNELNSKAIGFDMSSEENRRKAMEQAKDSGKAAASAKVLLVQEDLIQGNKDDRKNGFLIYLPIYKNGKLSESIEERRKNLIGYIYSPFRAADFLNEIQKEVPIKDVSVSIYDGSDKPENLFASTDDGAQVSAPINDLEKIYAVQTDLNVAGRKWVIKYNSLPAFAEQSSIRWTTLMLFTGTFLSFLLFGLTYWEANARAKLQVTAAELFESEKQKQGLLEKEKQARQSAEQANKIKDEFIAVVSHELRTPLNAIAGWTRILKTNGLSDNTKKLALEKVEKNLRLQTRLVEELLDYSQIISKNIKFEGRKIDFSNLFEVCCSEIEIKASDKKISFVKENQLNGQRIFGDEEKLKIVIHNLLSNAIKFTDSGGQIKTSIRQFDETIQLKVKDTGKGINPEFLPHIFDRFSQADTSSTRNYGGLGLGLAISNHIIKLHKGTIEASSEGIGKGSIFIIKLPVH